MKRCVFHRLIQWLPPSACFLSVLCLPLATAASPAPPDSVHHCVILDEAQWLREVTQVAGKQAADLNVGEPRTVRMIYFLPNDRPYRQSVVDTMKARMVQYQQFFGEQMEERGYGFMTFRYEADASGAPVVHRLDAKHSDWHYHHRTPETGGEEVWQAYDPNYVVLFIVIDNRAGKTIGYTDGVRAGGAAAGGKDGGKAYLPGGFGFQTAAHELGHAFGMFWHDYRDGTHIMASGGRGRSRLSACSAAYLSVSPYFNPVVPLETDWKSLPVLELLSSQWYTAGLESTTVRLKVTAPHGLHQLIALVPTPGSLFVEILGCRDLSGETDAEIEYEYDGATPSTARRFPTTLSNPPSHTVGFLAVDRRGNRQPENFTFAQRSPYHLATLEGHFDAVRVVAFSPDGSLLASGSRDRMVKLWDMETRDDIATLDIGGPNRQVTSLSFSPDGSLLAVGTISGNTALWDVASRQLAGTLDGHTRVVNTLAFSADGDTLVSGASYDEDRIKVWDVASRQLIGVLRGHTSHVRQVAFSPDGRVLASCSQDRTIRIWDLSAMKERYRLVRIGGGRISSIAFSPDGRILAANSTEEGLIVLWDWAAQRNIADVRIAHERGINYLTFSPDGESLATAGGGWVVVRDAATEKRGERFKVRQRFPHVAQPWTLAYWRDGSVLAVGTHGKGIELWDTSEWVQRRPDRVEVVSGLEQRGVAGTALPVPFVVSVRDQNGDPFPGMPVIFNVTGGGGTLSATAARTDTAGNASTTLTLGPAAGMNTVTAWAAGLSPAVFAVTAWGSPDMSGDGTVDFGDFVLFSQRFGTGRGDEGYDPRYDLDGDGSIGFSDFVIFAGAFGQTS